MPSAFKQIFDAMNETQLYITSTNGKTAEIWPLCEWVKREEKMAQSSTMNPAVRKYQILTSHYGAQVEMDNQGRTLLHTLLRNSARLDGEVTAIGMGNYIELHNREVYAATVANNALTETDEAELNQIFSSKS